MNHFKSNIQNLYGEMGKEWLLSLPKIIEDLKIRFHLDESLSPVTNLSYHYVLSGFQDNIPIILKLGLDEMSLSREAAALRCFKGFGAVNILAEGKGFLLLQRALPGTSLRMYFPDNDQESIDIACKVMSKLHKANIPAHYHFPHVKDWLSALDKDHYDIPNSYLQKSRSLRDQLLDSADHDVFLHGDLHHENILKADNEWLVIDPKGVIGEPAYEVAAFIRNPIPELLLEDDAAHIIQRRITAFSKNLHVPQERIACWCLVQAILSWVWDLEDGCDTAYWKNTIKILDDLVV